ncbi:MAG: superoxide dismutase family protein [Myxococcota bacterium]
MAPTPLERRRRRLLPIPLQALSAVALFAATACDAPDPGDRPVNPIPIAPTGAEAEMRGDPVENPMLVRAGAVAKADLAPTLGNEAEGTLTFRSTAHGVRVAVEMTGLTPGLHGLHLHEVGDCSAPDAGSAGGHFAPRSMPHGAPSDDRHHAGDFGNIEADDAGRVDAEFLAGSITLESADSPFGIVGRAAVVHADRDDLETQPSGDSGARVACGVIQQSDPV